MPTGHDPALRKVLMEWITLVRHTDQPVIYRWTRAAGVPHPTVYRFLSGETYSISPRNLKKLAKLTAVPLVRGL